MTTYQMQQMKDRRERKRGGGKRKENKKRKNQTASRIPTYLVNENDEIGCFTAARQIARGREVMIAAHMA